LKAELEALKSDLIEASRQLDISRFESALGKITVRLARKEKFVTKTDDAASFAELTALSRELKLDDYFTLDGNGLMREVFAKRRLPDEQLELLGKFVVEKEESRVTARLNLETENDDDSK
jgi:hypothetical protein